MYFKVIHCVVQMVLVHSISGSQEPEIDFTVKTLKIFFSEMWIIANMFEKKIWPIVAFYNCKTIFSGFCDYFTQTMSLMYICLLIVFHYQVILYLVNILFWCYFDPHSCVKPYIVWIKFQHMLSLTALCYTVSYHKYLQTFLDSPSLKLSQLFVNVWVS